MHVFERRPGGALLRCLLPLALGVGACSDSKSLSEILVSIFADDSTPTRLKLRARDLQGNTDEQDVVLPEDRNLKTEPYLLLVQPSTKMASSFLLSVVGFDSDAATDEPLCANSIELLFTQGQRVATELHLRSSFIDVDKDGVEACSAGAIKDCDCQDHNPLVSSFQNEICYPLDRLNVDNNCSGDAFDGCPCKAGDKPLPCAGDYDRSWIGIGACKTGVRKCVGGQWSSECQGPGRPGQEIADDLIDNNCNGTVDERSPCESGAKRACLLGFIGEQARALALGQCAKRDPATGAPMPGEPSGSQACVDGKWGDCTNDVWPLRAPDEIGWAESLQCDGTDNDCDGKIDNVPTFDADDDGYTACGSNVEENVEGLYPDLIDCNDGDSDVHPGAEEKCGNEIDEDCRCDHDLINRPSGTVGSVIGLPSLTLDPSTPNCAESLAYLKCEQLPHSGQWGYCSDNDGTDDPPYYWGYGLTSTGARMCFRCNATYGAKCISDTLQCGNAKAEDCSAACNPSSPQPSDENTDGSPRPKCFDEKTGACSGTTGPGWALVPAGGDPYNECAGVSCPGYYWGPNLDSFGKQACYPLNDATADQVGCSASPLCTALASGSCCQTSADVCKHELGAKSAPVSGSVARKLCEVFSSGCSGTTPPTYVGQNGTDFYSDCQTDVSCSAYYVTFDTGSRIECHYRANVLNGENVCASPPTGARCRTAAEACPLQSRGGEVPGRPVCKQASTALTSCTNLAGPSYVAIPANKDPFDECPGSECDGNGRCEQANGISCSNGSDCISGNCVDNACCATGVCSTCQTCSTGTCVDVTIDTTDDTCAGTTGCSLGSCTCKANSGECVSGSGATGCQWDNQCLGYCECANGNCSATRCTSRDCATCQYRNTNQTPPYCSNMNNNAEHPDCPVDKPQCDGNGACK